MRALPHQEPVAIGRLERFVADWSASTQRRRDGRAKWPAQKVALVGTGPAGLTVAFDFARLGYPVTIFEALHNFGGVLRYGIPQYRLPKEIVDEDVEHLKALGVEFVRDVIVGKTVTIDELIEETATQRSSSAPAPARRTSWTSPARTSRHLLRQRIPHSRQPDARLLVPEYDTPIHRPKRAAVIGAGETAMDAVRCSIRLGAHEAQSCTGVRGREGRAGGGLRAGARRGRDLRLAHPSQALPR